MYMHVSGMSQDHLPVLPCMCGNFRRTARALTQLYDQALRPLGLRATQFTILQFLSLAGEVSQGHLGEMLAMDSTTLTRTLEIMARRGWIAERRGEGRLASVGRRGNTWEGPTNPAPPARPKHPKSLLRPQGVL